MEDNSWIKLHRKLLANPVCLKDGDHLAVWITLLLKATHKELPVIFKGKSVVLQPGQLITGRRVLSQLLKIDQNKIQRILLFLKNEHLIEQQTGNKNRLVTIRNWNRYQKNEQQTKQQVNNNRTTSEQQVNTNKNIKNMKNDKKRESTLFTRTQFLKNKDQIKFEAGTLYPDKNIGVALEEFISQTEIKDYKYKNYKLAFLKWVRDDRFGKYGLNRPNVIGTKTKLAIN